MAAAAPQERPDRRRVGSMLSAYYGIQQNAQPGRPAPAPVAPMDRPNFDAKQHFDDEVATGSVADVLKAANECDAEVKDLDGDMQMVVYENYSKFIKATEVTGEVKVSVTDMEPDICQLEKSFGLIAEYQRKVEEGVSGRARQVELLLKRQKLCQKMQVLFALPATLQKCLDRGAYGKACEAYCACAGFLRQYKHFPTFKSLLEDVDVQMGRIRSALEQRLCSKDLSVQEAVNSSVALLDLGEEAARVSRDFLRGRSACLRLCLESCFDVGSKSTGEQDRTEAADEVAHVDQAADFLRDACTRSSARYVPELVDAVDGFHKLKAERQDGFDPEEELSDFVSRSVEDLCNRVAELAEEKRPPTEALVSCVHSVRDSLRRLHSLMPRLLAKVFTNFLSRISSDAARALFAKASSSMVSELVALHGEYKALDFKGPGMDQAIEHVCRSELAIAAHATGAVYECQPLLSLISSEKAACQQLVHTLQEQVVGLSATFCASCRAISGEEEDSAPAAASAAEQLTALDGLEWIGFFALAMVWLGRRWEERVVSKPWAHARELFVGVEAAGSLPTERLVPSQAAASAVTTASQVMLSHYVRVSGQRVAHFLRNSVQRKGWAQASRAPQDPSLVVEMVFKEVHAFDSQLGRVLGDPRKARSAAPRRNFNLNTSAMEMDLERQLAKKAQIFAIVPFNRNGAVVGIFRIAFKALFEYVREETFTTFGLQQLQLDSELLNEISRDYVDADDAGTLGSFVSEAVGSASQRCSSPQLLEAAVLEALVRQKKGALRVE